jgi:hypothetical protein
MIEDEFACVCALDLSRIRDETVLAEQFAAIVQENLALANQHDAIFPAVSADHRP